MKLEEVFLNMTLIIIIKNISLEAQDIPSTKKDKS